MSARMVRPSARVAARRRRLLVWWPLLVAGVLVSLAGAPMVTVFNSLDIAGLVLMVGAVAGFIFEVED